MASLSTSLFSRPESLLPYEPKTVDELLDMPVNLAGYNLKLIIEAIGIGNADKLHFRGKSPTLSLDKVREHYGPVYEALAMRDLIRTVDLHLQRFADYNALEQAVKDAVFAQILPRVVSEFDRLKYARAVRKAEGLKSSDDELTDQELGDFAFYLAMDEMRLDYFRQLHEVSYLNIDLSSFPEGRVILESDILGENKKIDLGERDLTGFIFDGIRYSVSREGNSTKVEVATYSPKGGHATLVVPTSLDKVVLEELKHENPTVWVPALVKLYGSFTSEGLPLSD